MQEDVRTEDDKNESEKNPGNHCGNFHCNASCLIIRNSNLEISSVGFRSRWQNSSVQIPARSRTDSSTRFGFEDFAGNIASGAGMFRVVGIDSFHGIGDFVHRSK